MFLFVKKIESNWIKTNTKTVKDRCDFQFVLSISIYMATFKSTYYNPGVYCHSLYYDLSSNYLSLSLSPFLSLLSSVCLSNCKRLYLDNYVSDFDETWWKSCNLGPINCIKVS